MDQATNWTEETLQEYITNQVEESLTLDYKGADALDRTDKKKREITKDVSAMANSAGGILIYGIREFDDHDKRHLPERIDPVNASTYSKEWLEQVIANIQPRIANLRIYPVRLSSPDNHAAYIVEIPQSNVAHQAKDKRYYKRYNFESVAMDDYEINDIRNRQHHPLLDLHLQFRITRSWEASNRLAEWKIALEEASPAKRESLEIEGVMVNTGTVYARFVNGSIVFPVTLVEESFQDDFRSSDRDAVDGVEYVTWTFDNTRRDVVDYEWNAVGGGIEKYGPSWHDPILPGLSHSFSVSLRHKQVFDRSQFSGKRIYWQIYADNAPVQEGSIEIDSIPITIEDDTLNGRR